MRCGPTSLVLLCLFLCLCNGAPPRDVDKNSYHWIKFSDQEDMLIIEELTSLLDIYGAINSKDMWETIAEKHREKCKQGTEGFFPKRSRESLRCHFKRHFLSKDKETRVKVPETLMRKLKLLIRKKSNRDSYPLGGRGYPFTAQEDDLICKELSKPSCSKLYSSSTLKAIHAEHNSKHQANTPGFEYARTFDSIRSRVFVIWQRGQLPEEVMKKFPIGVRGESSSQVIPRSEECDFQVMDELEDEDDWESMIERFKNNANLELDFNMFDSYISN